MRFFKTKFSKALFCLMLGVGAIAGAPLNPDELEELLAAMTAPKVAHTLPEEAEGDDPRSGIKKGEMPKHLPNGLRMVLPIDGREK